MVDLIAMIAFTIVFGMYNARVNLSALILFFFGLLVASLRIWVISPGAYAVPRPWTGWPTVAVPSANDFSVGFFNAALGQLPLTLLNAVIATSCLADDLFPERPHPVAPITKLGLFLGSMNMISMWFGCIPYCNGVSGRRITAVGFLSFVCALQSFPFSLLHESPAALLLSIASAPAQRCLSTSWALLSSF
jgi:hypothetical protein